MLGHYHDLVLTNKDSKLAKHNNHICKDLLLLYSKINILKQTERKFSLRGIHSEKDNKDHLQLCQEDKPEQNTTNIVCLESLHGIVFYF